MPSVRELITAVLAALTIEGAKRAVVRACFILAQLPSRAELRAQIRERADAEAALQFGGVLGTARRVR